MGASIKRAAILASIPILTLVLFTAVVIDVLTDGNEWNIDSIEDYLEVSIPADAEFVEFEGRRGRGGALYLAFEASDDSVDAFASGFCGDSLFQGYDPFNAVDTSEQRSDAYMIRMGEERYYSYSPDTPDTLFGTRCFGSKGQIQILVDRTSSEITRLKMEVQFSCYKCNVQ
jgi:hypothetical protein